MVEAYFEMQLRNLSMPPEVQESILTRLQLSNSQVTIEKPRRRPKPQKPKPEPPSQNHRISLMDKQQRLEYYEEERRKAEASKERTKELMAEQKRRQQKLKDLQEAEMRRFLEQQATTEKLVQEQEAQFKERYQLQLQAMRRKKEEKTQKIEDLKERGKNYPFLSQKPLFKVLEQKYHQEVELPTLEQRKAELAKLRMLNAPLQKDKLKEHMSWYEERKKQDEERIKRNVSQRRLEERVGEVTRKFGSSVGQRLYQEDKAVLNSHKTALQDKIELMNKRKNYAQVVKEVFPPSVDSSKAAQVRQQMQKRSAPQLKSKKRLAESIQWKPRKYPKNPLVPEPKEKPNGLFVDYLALRRKAREELPKSTKSAVDWNSLSFEGEDKVAQLKLMSNSVENELKRHTMSSHTNVEGLKSAEEVNDMLVSSIKAKLSVLESMAK